MKGVGRIYQQTFIDTYTKVVFAKLYDRKTPITAAEILNSRGGGGEEEHGIVLCRVLTDRGTEYCGNPEHHDYELYLAVEDMNNIADKNQGEGSASASIEPCSISSIAWRSARRSIEPSTSCRMISMVGCRRTTKRARIRDDGAMEKHQCKPSLTRCPLRGKNCCRPRSAGHKSSSDNRHDEEPLSGQVHTFTPLDF